MNSCIAWSSTDAWLHPSFDVYTAGFNGGTATWMGASETVRPKGLLGFLGSNQVSGNVPAIALEVVIEDMTGRNLFVDIGGLQVLDAKQRSTRGLCHGVPCPESCRQA